VLRPSYVGKVQDVAVAVGGEAGLILVADANGPFVQTRDRNGVWTPMNWTAIFDGPVKLPVGVNGPNTAVYALY
jgi:hypothetical protein